MSRDPSLTAIKAETLILCMMLCLLELLQEVWGLVGYWRLFIAHGPNYENLVVLPCE